MPKALKFTLIALGAVAALMLAVVAVIVATFDPNAYKPLLIERMQKERQRTLAIPGPISLTFFPRLGVKVGTVSLSERQSAREFASLQSAQVSLAVWPLLRREVVVDRIVVTGLRAEVTRLKDGRLSIDDLTADRTPSTAPAGSAEPPAPYTLDIAGIAITDAALTYVDHQAPRRVQLSRASVETGRIAPGLPVPVAVKGRLEADAPQLAADLALDGRLVPGPAPGRLRVEALKLALGMQLEGQALNATLTGTFEGDTGAQRYAVDGLALDATLPHPRGGALALTAKGTLAAQLGDKGHLEAKLAGRVDESQFTLAFGMPRLAPAAFTFDAEIDRLDLDRYRSAGAPAAAASAPAVEKPLGLSALRDLDARGQLRIGALQVMNLKAGQLRAGLRAADGRVVLEPLAAALYEGQLAGSASVAATATPRFGLDARLSGVSIGPLLKDLTGKDPVEGRGNVDLNVTTAGATVGAMTKALDGRAALQLKDGAVRGVNIAQTIRKARARLGGGGGDGTAAKDEATDFSEMTASFAIAGGVAHSDDLVAKTPLLRVGGAGDIDLGGGRLDYLVRATVVATLEGQGGPELQALRGQTVPVKLSGPFSAIGWKIDFSGMAREAARKELDAKGEQLKDEAKKKLGDKLKGLLGR